MHNSANMVAEHRRSMAVIEMTESLQRVGEQLLELSVEERNFPWKSGTYCRWRMEVPPVVVVQRGASSPALSRKKFKSTEQQASHAREYVVAKVEDEMQRIRDGIPALMDENLIPLARTGESKELHQIHVDQTAQRFPSCNSLMVLLCRSSIFHRRWSRKRKLRSHSWILSRKPLRPWRPKRFMALKPLTV